MHAEYFIGGWMGGTSEREAICNLCLISKTVLYKL